MATEAAQEQKYHRKFAVDLFNYVWTLLEKPDRTRAEDDTMLNAAHASRLHWEMVGKPVNLARGDWQISHVYCVLGRIEPALYHARRCLEICKGDRIVEQDDKNQFLNDLGTIQTPDFPNPNGS
jgi:hypothetical protein